MTQKNLVYHKSSKGLEAIATRQHGLTPKLRSMLILIDGKRGLDELARLSQALGDDAQLLEQLRDQGFIELAAGPAASAPAPLGASAPAPLASAPAPLAAGATAASALSPMALLQAQRFAVRRLTDALGPNSEALCLRIESARNAQEFLAAVAKAERMVKEFRGTSAAAQFAADIQAHRPA